MVEGRELLLTGSPKVVLEAGWINELFLLVAEGGDDVHFQRMLSSIPAPHESE
jgi:hypothetical protein